MESLGLNDTDELQNDTPEFYYVEPTGPYGVGHKRVLLEGETTPPVSIFYPIDKTDYETYK